MRKTIPVMIALLFLSACATYSQPTYSPSPYIPSYFPLSPPPPTAEEISEGQHAIKPSSQKRAEQATITFWNTLLKDPESARYTFLHPVNGYWVRMSQRYFGWFMCGTVNAKNSFGGYVGARVFIAYFAPNLKDTVIYAKTDDGVNEAEGRVDDQCNKLYAQSQ